MLINTLKSLFPMAVPGIDYVLQDDGEDAYIKTWNLSASQPTAAQLSAGASAAASAAAQKNQIAMVSAACASALTAGFSSSALGSPRNYPSQDTDQRNLLNAVTASQGQASTWNTARWCANNVAWSLASHTAAQVQQVNADWLVFRVAAQQKYASLVTEINSATSVAAVQAINWSDKSKATNEAHHRAGFFIYAKTH
ncbi:hypothetical protein PPGU19_026270 [Paraburkholderia sp. PGU19]|uniref:XkdW family protein n=1 Tax=Paraburkholderia sp. PGU19 TaxID=2735434 RepID=UPI0015DAE912|nr:XkdW family protein [Paraburkholderia sp. PGU19]BCF98058.1 hypothetical protein PPGU19_026270 [Paraburkholderia sp. PGU19]